MFDDLIPKVAGATAGAAAGLFDDLVPVGGTRTTTGADGRPRLVMDMTPAPAKPDRGITDAAARGVASGLTANFSDELRGLVEASGANPDEPASVYKLLHGALKYWGGDAEAKKRYDDTTKRERDLTKTAEDQHPIASIAGNVAGAVMLPIGGMASAATLPGRMAAGAGIGAGLGAASGAGEGVGLADTVAKTGSGFLVGGAVGAAAPAVIRGLEAGAGGISRALEPLTNARRGFADPEAEAARRVVSAVTRDYKNGAPGLSGAEYRAAQAEGLPTRVIDLGGETVRGLARSSANTSPEGRAILNRAIDDRFEGQGSRFTSWLNESFHYPDASAQATALTEASKAVNRPAYAKALAQGRAGVMDEELWEMSQAPIVKDAVAAALNQAKNKSAGGTIDAGSNARWVNDGKPTLEFWDLVKRQIDQEINVAKRAGRNEDVATATQVKNQIVQKLDDSFPSYAEARAGASHFFGAQDALEAGQNFVTKNVPHSDVRRALAAMQPIERQLFQDGFVSKYIETLDRVGDRRSILNKIAEAPAARQKLEIALGRTKAAELETRLRVEGIMDLARGAVQGNSTTARQLIEAGLAGGAGYGITTGDWNPQNVFTAAFVGGLARGAASKANTKIDQRVAKSVAEMLVSSDPRVLQRGVNIVSKNPAMIEALRRADSAISRVGGEQSGGTSLVPQMTGVGRAEDQPSVPRPPGQ